MKSISESNSTDSYREPILKKGYVKIFIVGITFAIAGLLVLSLLNMVPRISYGDPGYYDYINLVRILSSLSRLLFQIGLVLFILSFFIGGLTDRTLSDNIRKGLVLASGVTIFGLVILIMYSSIIYYY
ncbi:MAG: hypothetical protein ACFE9Q_08600 [Candidatus Hodarchaeota archaeon]